jgi:hypothetical protein
VQNIRVRIQANPELVRKINGLVDLNPIMPLLAEK